MGDPNYDRLREREREVDQWLMASKEAVTEPGALQSRRLEKTIIIAAGAIVEAIWKARN